MRTKYIYSILSAIACVLFSNISMAQSEVFNITDYPSYETCDAIMHDSNGGLVPYSPSSNNTITLCAPLPETQVNLYFIGFNLSDGDVLTIYDGPNTASPVLASASGEDLLFETFSSSTGCLTVNFTSNDDAEVGDFSVRISCGVPCDYPIALIEAEADTMKVCVGETVSFDGTASSWTQGASLTNIEWDMGDQLPNSFDELTVSYSYPNPGGYRVRLYIEDSNGCSSANIPEIVVLVSTPYVFDLATSTPVICVGSEVVIGREAFAGSDTLSINEDDQNGNSVTWVEQQILSFENGVYIPDNQGCLYAELTFNQFGTATLSSPDDIASVLMNLEHSFVGDITINIICPNGQVMSLWPEAGGSGTFLGEPIDDESGVPGVGYDYTFSPNSTGPTWLDLINSSFPSTIPAGDYSADGDWNDLVGCPLNGTWQLEVCDIVGADDGWVFEFGIFFAPEFYPNVLQFTPVVNNDCASSYWESQFQFTDVGPNCDWVAFEPEAPGVYNFVYHVINDFGCEFSDDISITAVQADAGPDVPYCGSNDQLVGSLDPSGQPVTYTYAWSPAQFVNNPAVINPFLQNITEETEMFLTVTMNVNGTTCEMIDSTMVTIPVAPNTIDRDHIFPCTEEFPYEIATALQTIPNLTYVWTYDNVLDGIGGDSLLSTIGAAHYDDEMNGYFMVVISEPQCGFSVMDTIQVTGQVCNIEIPNIMSPNGDGDNDTFNVNGIRNFNGSTVLIFNRWGNLVYEDKDYGGDWGAQDQPDGTYYYILGINYQEGMKYHEGTITVVRD